MGSKKRAYGSDAQLLMAFASAEGQMPDGSGGGVYTKITFKSSSLGAERPLGYEPLLGQGADAQDPHYEAITDDGDIEVPLDLRQTGFILKGVMGAPATTGVAATGTIAFDGEPSAGDTITLDGVAWTFVASGATGNETNLKGTVTTTLDQLVTDLNASADADISAATYSRDTGTQTLTVTHDTADITGNAFTLAANITAGATISGSTLTGGGYDHVFTSGGDLPEVAAQLGHAGLSTPVYFNHPGAKLGGLAFDLGRSGKATARVPVIAIGETEAASAVDASPAEFTFKGFQQGKGYVTLGGTKLSLTGGSFNYSNNLEPVETINDTGLIDGVDETERTADGTVQLRFSIDSTVRDAVKAETPVAMEYGYTMPGALGGSLMFSLPRVYLPKKKQEVPGPGGIEATYEWRAAKDATAGHMLQVTLHNDVASYA